MTDADRSATEEPARPVVRGRWRRRALAATAALAAIAVVAVVVVVIRRPVEITRGPVDAAPGAPVDARVALAPACTTADDCAARCAPPAAAPAACTRLALLTALLDDRRRAPSWIDPAQAPAGLLDAACRDGGDRGLLACAALELLRVPLTEAAAVRARLAGCPLASPVACATALVHDLCDRDGLPEACYLAARAPGSGVDSPETQALVAACRRQREPALCHHAWLASGAPELLDLACPDDDEGAGIARACLDRAYLVRARRKELSLRACRLGLCERVTDVAALTEQCDAGVLDACARLLPLPVRQLPADRRDHALARAAELAPDVDLARPPAPPAPKLLPAYQACRYGVADACAAVVDELPPASPLAGLLAAYAARLKKPLTP